jgi:hypothetical protein
MRMLWIIGMFIMLTACAILTASIMLWLQDNSRADGASSYTSVAHTLRVQGNESGTVEALPLVVEAQAFAQYLNPAKTAERLPRFARNDMASSAPAANPAPSAPVVRPPAPSVRFKVYATSYYPNEPGRSMALVSDVGSAEGDQRWVKEGAKLGHFVIHEIRRGMIVYRDGEQLREMAVERGTALPRLVRDPRPGSPTARAATPADPDTIEIRGE